MKLANTPRPLRASMQGVTLLELITAVTVLAVLVGLGVPSFINASRSNQIAAEANNLTTSLNLARSEAMKRGVRVSLCPAIADHTDCSDEPAWSNGWLIFSDDFGDAGVLDENDVILQDSTPVTVGVAIASPALDLTFMPDATVISAAIFTLSKQGCGKDQGRVVAVQASGRIGLTRVNCL